MKKVLAIIFLLSSILLKAQSVEFTKSFDRNTKQTMLIKFEKADNPNMYKALFLVVDTIYELDIAASSGQLFYLRDSTQEYKRRYIGFSTDNFFDKTSVFSNKDKTEFWIWIVNDKKELEKSFAPNWLYTD